MPETVFSTATSLCCQARNDMRCVRLYHKRSVSFRCLGTTISLKLRNAQFLIYGDIFLLVVRIKHPSDTLSCESQIIFVLMTNSKLLFDFLQEPFKKFRRASNDQVINMQAHHSYCFSCLLQGCLEQGQQNVPTIDQQAQGDNSLKLSTLYEAFSGRNKVTRTSASSSR